MIKSLEVFENHESEVRSYIRNFPTKFSKASGSKLIDINNQEYIDFFAGAATMNYGHNDTDLMNTVIEYIKNEGIVHSLDLATVAKEDFIEAFNKIILEPREMADWKMQFVGPTGASAVEASCKLARKIKQNPNIGAFTGAFHGMSKGAADLTGNTFKRGASILPSSGVVRLPYDNFYGDNIDTADIIEKGFSKKNSGFDIPAAIILETVQGEGGINVAKQEWLKRIEHICKRFEILLIIDDIQAGIGRTGSFFSSENTIDPDMILLSKSLSGVGSPMSMVLMKPEHDQWLPGEHNGTFRGFNLSFITAKASLEKFWQNDNLSELVQKQGEKIRNFLHETAIFYKDFDFVVKGKGMMNGIESKNKPDLAKKISQIAFKNGLIMETSGANGEVAKITPPLNISDNDLNEGLQILKKSIDEAVIS